MRRGHLWARCAQAPWLALVCFGSYSLFTIGHGLSTFGTCPEAAEELNRVRSAALASCPASSSSRVRALPRTSHASGRNCGGESFRTLRAVARNARNTGEHTAPQAPHTPYADPALEAAALPSKLATCSLNHFTRRVMRLTSAS